MRTADTAIDSWAERAAPCVQALTGLPLWRGEGRAAGRCLQVWSTFACNFFRAHPAWYTDRAPDAAQWGYAAFGGRSARMVDALAVQDGLYTLVTRSTSKIATGGACRVCTAPPTTTRGSTTFDLRSSEW